MIAIGSILPAMRTPIMESTLGFKSPCYSQVQGGWSSVPSVPGRYRGGSLRADGKLESGVVYLPEFLDPFF